MIRESRLFVITIGFCITVGIFSCASFGGDVRQRFFEAENCYQALRADPDRMKIRSSWQQCIDGFMGVYLNNPSGPWASAGLYRAGVLYDELHQYSGRASDRQQAEHLLQQVVRRYPESEYSNRARQQLQRINGEPSTEVRLIKPKTEGKAKMTFLAAEACRKRLEDSPQKKKYRSYWKDCIELFDDVYQHDPEGEWAAEALFRSGVLHCDLYRYSYRHADQQKGVSLLEKVVAQYPESSYHARAVAALEAVRAPGRPVIAGSALPPATEERSPPVAAAVPEASAITAQNAGERVVVGDLRYWSNPTYTRVVIDAGRQTEYTHNVLDEDRIHNKPRRLYVDLQNSQLHQDLARTVSINDNLLKDVRVGQFQPDIVRVVVDLKSLHGYKIFSLRDPFRIVVDVSGQAIETIEAPTDRDNGRKKPAELKEEPASLAAQLGLNVKRIVIDPGHGGRDGGAPGFLKGVHEKDLVLEMAKKLAQMIRRDLGCEVILTRDRDVFLTLEERTAIANMKNADLFISLHTNASMNRQAYGIETYILNLATDDDAMRVAARENSTSTKNISDLQTILKDLMQNTKINESSRLAGYVQTAMVEHLQKHYSGINNKGVKQAPFYVLLGAQMPAILIEAGFISNSQECRRLTQADYQTRVCEGIVKGIKAYMEKTKAAAFIQNREG